MLFNSLADPQSSVDIEQIECLISEALDAARLKQAWTYAIQRHAILRTRFRWNPVGEPQQEILSDSPLRWEEFDWRHLSPEDRHARWQQQVATARREGFDLATAPPMRFALARETLSQYRFCWTHHHALVDGRSYVILWNEIMAAYDALAHGESPSLAPVRSFGEHAEWLHAQDWSPSEEFWRERLRGITAPTPLPVMFTSPRLVAEADICGDQELALSPVVTAALRSFAQSHEVTLNTLLQAAWALLLSRYSRQGGVMFGAVRAGRQSASFQAQNIVGPFITTVPVRAEVPTDAPLTSWLRELREQWIALRPHELVPLTRLQAWSEVPRGRPLFTTLLNVQDPPWDAALSVGRTKNFRFSIRSRPSYPLALDVYASADLKLRVFYDRRWLEDGAARRLLGHVATILEAMPQHLGRAPSALPLLTPDERFQVTIAWNRTERPYPGDCGIHGLFEGQVARRPAATAVRFNDASITYAELNKRALSLARRLVARGVRRGALVGICTERSIATAVGLLAILKAGGAYVPLDPTYPDERLAFMIEDAGLACVLTQEPWHHRFAQARVATIELDAAAPEPNGEMPLPTDVGGGDLAYVMYTSGSAGVPKGVAVPHRAVIRLVLNTDYVQLGPDDRIAQASSVSFDAATFEFWGALLSGAELIGMDQDTLLSPTALASHISRYRITTLFITTALFNLLAREAPGIFGGIKQVLFGGERVDPKWVLQVWRTGRPDRLLHVYGPTETTTFATWFEVTSVEPGATTLPIGRPLANTRAYVLDPFDQPVPVGVPGELWIGGDAVACGYFNRPDLTAASFRPDPFAANLAARRYRTGDLVRARPDGNLEFLGRLDHQVKIRGFRVELGEIEAALCGEAGVRGAVAIVREDAPGDRRLVAYVAASPEEFDADLLRRRLEQRMPPYMLPSAIVRLDVLPLTANGKIDRQCLPRPSRAAVIISKRGVQPQTSIEQQLADIWASVLGIDHVGRYDSFIELGGDSLLALQAVVRMNQVFKLGLPVSAILQHPTLAEFAETIVRTAGSDTARAPMMRVSGDRGYPLSFFQERIWKYATQAADPRQFISAIPIKLEAINVAALERSLRQLVQRHDILRTVYGVANGQPVQFVQSFETMEFEFPVQDLSSRPNQGDELKRIVLEEQDREFDLSRGPLFRFRLVRTGGERYLLILTFHHLLYDATLRWLALKELEQLYDAYSRNLPNPLSERPARRYVDFAVWQRQRFDRRSEIYQHHARYWVARLGPDLEPMRFPFCRSERPVGDVKPGLASLPRLRPSVCEGLKVLAQSRGATLFMTLLAALKAWLSDLTGSTDILVGVNVNQQDLPEMDGVVGPSSNLLALRTDVAGDPTFVELLDRVRQVTLDAFAHQEMPFEEVVAALQTAALPPPPIQIIFQLVKTATPLVSLPGVRGYRTRVKSMPWGLTVVMHEHDERRVAGGAGFDSNLYDPPAVREAVARYRALLARIAEEPERRLSEYFRDQHLAPASPAVPDQIGRNRAKPNARISLSAISRAWIRHHFRRHER